MANRYRVTKPGTESKKINIGIQKDKPLIGKGKIVAILFFGTLLVAGIYIAAMYAHFMAIFHIYWIITAVLLCAFACMSKYSEYLYTRSIKADGSMSEQDKQQHLHRTKRIKLLLLVLLPFLFTVIGDTVYVLFFQDSGIIQAITKLFAA